MQNNTKKLFTDYFMSVAGAIIFSAALNLFIVPYNLLSANFTGVAQIVRGLIMEYSGLPIPESFNLTGLLLAVIDIPLIILGYRHMDRHFFIKTILASVATTVAISVIPVPAAPLLDSILTSGIIGGIVAGFGVGLTLRSGGSGGGVDIVGILMVKRNPNFSVGQISIVIGAAVLVYALFQYDLNLVVYSGIYTVVYSVTLDKVHYQTIKTGAMVFAMNESQDKQVRRYITETLSRGATCWTATGAYTGEDVYISYSVVSKSEALALRRELQHVDPDIFVVFTDGMDVIGQYESHL